ncbi:MAG: hypothetical protein Q8O13_00260 [Candidatus Omnitrophota bacterium]|nr:hypothetical protein [Candidatus Omnitrophota bacterium]
MKEKQVLITVSASGQVKELALSPGATVQEVLDEAGLQDYQLSKEGGEPFPLDGDLYSLVADGEKLSASPANPKVGRGGSASLRRIANVWKTAIDSIRNKLRTFLNRIKNHRVFRPKRVRIIRTRYIQRSDGTKKARITKNYKRKVARVTKEITEGTYWQKNGWGREKNEYKGYFKTKYGKWRGLVREIFAGEYLVYIFKPPSALEYSTHWECFISKGNGLYLVHFSQKPRDVSSAIMAVEEVISESIADKRKENNDDF